VGGRLASGSVPAAGGQPAYTGSTVMAIASASKWLYGAYVVQLRQGQLTDSDIKFLTFRSGYTSFSRCLPGQTVDACVAYQNNGVYSARTDGYFSYGGGHMEKHASLTGLGPADNTGLAAALQVSWAATSRSPTPSRSWPAAWPPALTTTRSSCARSWRASC
jgi:hypothetical protein